MIEVKVQCACGSKYKFDAEPVSGRLPAPVQCPACGADGTAAANQFIGQSLGAPAVGAETKPTLRVAAAAPPVAAGAEGVVGQSSHGARGLLERSSFFIKEHAALLKLTDTYDILDPATGQAIGIAKEEPHALAKWLRLVIKKSLMPTRVNIYEHEGHPPVLSIYRGVSFLRTKVKVLAADGQQIGYFKSKLFSLGGGFLVFDNADRQVADVKGDWKGWNFKFLDGAGRELGTVTKKWAGLGKELFTSADNYIISFSDLGGAGPAGAALLLAAGLAIDVVFKEKN